MALTTCVQAFNCGAAGRADSCTSRGDDMVAAMDEVVVDGVIFISAFLL